VYIASEIIEESKEILDKSSINRQLNMQRELPVTTEVIRWYVTGLISAESSF